MPDIPLSTNIEPEIVHVVLPNDQQVLSVVKSWRKAWSAQDVISYLEHYADDFHASPRFSSIQRWRVYKKRVISGSKFIKVKLTNIQVKFNQEDNQVSVTFDQFFTNDKTNAKDAKILIMKKYNGSWKIVSETVMN